MNADLKNTTLNKPMYKLTEQARLKSTLEIWGKFPDMTNLICRRGLQTLIFAISFRWII
jgi:hypothetical protein